MSEITKLFTGITVDKIEDNEYNFETENGKVQVFQKISFSNDHCKTIEFTFKLSMPSRFRIDFYLPENISNACVTLNNRMLLGLFSPVLRDDCIMPYTDECTGNGSGDDSNERISTLLPGRYQSINFKWFNTDSLKFHLYY